MTSLTPEIDNLIQIVAQQQNILQYEISEVQFNEKGEGYLGEICLVTLLDKVQNRNIHLVVKSSFRNEAVRGALPIKESFENEAYFYSTIYPLIKNFVGGKQLDFKEFAAKCYYATAEDKCECLILDNLKPQGFETINQKELLDENHIELIFQTYGRVHAYFAAFRQKNEEAFLKIVKNLRPSMKTFLLTQNFKNAVLGTCQLANSCLISGRDDEIKKQFKKYLQDENAIQIFADCFSSKNDFATFIHGDCWSNNLFFKYEKSGADKRPVDIRLIDFQMINVASPICDLSYCLYSGSSKTEFDKLDRYLELYHTSFSTTVAKLGGRQLITLDQLKEQWKIFSKFGMLMSFVMMKIKLMEKKDAFDLNDQKRYDGFNKNSFVDAPCDQDELKRRMRDLVMHMYEIGAL